MLTITQQMWFYSYVQLLGCNIDRALTNPQCDITLSNPFLQNKSMIVYIYMAALLFFLRKDMD